MVSVNEILYPFCGFRSRSYLSEKRIFLHFLDTYKWFGLKNSNIPLRKESRRWADCM